MSTYYQYQDVKRMIAHYLMHTEGWTVYGYTPDESDSMTDYYSPAHWSGVAQKNGYVLCVDVYGAAVATPVRRYGKQSQNVTEIIPAHMKNPSRCNWHIEKDGVYIAKGSGLLKYADLYNYVEYPAYKKELECFRTSKENFIRKKSETLFYSGYYTTMEEALCAAEYHAKSLQKSSLLLDSFMCFMQKIETICNDKIKEDNSSAYQKITVTEYETKLQAVETATGEIKEGQYFILKTDFNGNRKKGFVYCIHQNEYNGKPYFYALRLNGKLTKECSGLSNPANHWSGLTEHFLQWMDKDYIAWCDIQEYKTPIKKEKLVKKAVKVS